MKRYAKRTKYKIFMSIILIFLSFDLIQIKSQPSVQVVTFGKHRSEAQQISNHLNQIISFVNSGKYDNRAELRKISTDAGLEMLVSTIKNSIIRFERNNYRKKLITLPGEGFEVRDLEIRRGNENHKTDYLESVPALINILIINKLNIKKFLTILCVFTILKSQHLLKNK